MAKTKSVFVCSECGAKVPKWQGKCNNCGNWDTFIEEIVDAPVKGNSAAVRVKSAASAVKLNEINSDKESRYKTGLKECPKG